MILDFKYAKFFIVGIAFGGLNAFKNPKIIWPRPLTGMGIVDSRPGNDENPTIYQYHTLGGFTIIRSNRCRLNDFLIFK